MSQTNTYENRSSAKNRLGEIKFAKDFLQGSQYDNPDLFDYYQKQIDDLTNEENGITSMLGEEGSGDDYGIYDDNEDDPAVVQMYVNDFKNSDDDGNPINPPDSQYQTGTYGDEYTYTSPYVTPADTYASSGAYLKDDNEDDPAVVQAYVNDFKNSDDDGNPIYRGSQADTYSYTDSTTPEATYADYGSTEQEAQPPQEQEADYSTADTSEDEGDSSSSETQVNLSSDPVGDNVPYTDENRAKYQAILESNKSKIDELQKTMSNLEQNMGITDHPDLDNQLQELYDENNRIEKWLSGGETGDAANTDAQEDSSTYDYSLSPDPGADKVPYTQENKAKYLKQKENINAQINDYLAAAGSVTGEDSSDYQNMIGQEIERLSRERDAIDKWLSGYGESARIDSYDAIPDAPDYGKYSKAATDGRYGSIYDYINDIGNTRETVYDGVGAENNSLAIYEMMTQDEIGRYNYLCATLGGDEAERYLKSIRETLNRRLGEKIAGDIKGSTGLQIIYGLNTGADRAANEAASFITGDSTRTAASYAKELIRQELAKTGGQINGSSLAKIAFDVMDYTGHEVPYAALEYITGSLLAEAGIAASKSGRMLWSGGDD